MKVNTKGWLLILALSISLSAAFIFYQLMSRPFGILFNMSFYLLSGGLVFCFLILAIMSFKSLKRWLKVIGLIPALLSIVLFLLTVVISTDLRMLYFTGIPPSPTNDEWMQDVQYLGDQIQEIYPDIYSKVSKEQIAKTVNEINARIPDLSESDIVMELFRLTALPNDAHTIPFIFVPCFDLHDFPIKIFRFEDGWYIVDAASAYSDLVGTKILKVDSTTIEDLFQKFQPYLAAENYFSQLERFTYIGLMPEFLQSQGIIDNLNNAQFTLEKENGEQVIEIIDAVRFLFKFYWSAIASVDNHASSVFSNPRKDSYWFEYLESSKTIYFQFNEVYNQDGKETIAEFTKRLEEFVNNNEFDRFIVDLRNNMGGNDAYLKPLIDMIRDSKKINQRNKLFVLIGRRTFSSAVLFAYRLKLQTKANFIGEPTGQGPVFGGNPTQVELPNSGLIFAIATTSTARTQVEWSFRIENSIVPDTIIPYSYADFKTDKDPVMESALRYKSNESTSETVSETILENHTGRFLLSPLQILEVKRNGTNLSFTIDDFTSYNLFRVQSDLFAESEYEFETDIQDVSISFPKDSLGISSSVVLSWKGQLKVLQRAPKDYITALELLTQNKIEEAIQQINLHRAEYSKLLMLENILNTTGYEFLKNNKIEDAIKVFTLAVELFPDSWNVYDSLGEAYIAAGNNELAIANYEKSLELNPENTSGKEALGRLKTD